MWVGLDEEDMPSFALVKDICVMETNLSDIWFVTEVLHTAAFSKHFNAYEVNNTRNLSVIKQQELVYPLPLHIITIRDQEDEKHLVFSLLTTLENMQISTYMAYILSLIDKQWQTLKMLGEGVNKIEDIQV
jgi:hypothetical protein